MTEPHATEVTSAIDASPPESAGGIGILPLLGACLACCVPMLLVLGVVSVGAALAGAAGLAILIAVVVAVVWWTSRRHRR